MSEITTIFDTLVTRTQALLPSHVRLSNPYTLEQNNEQKLRQGWGLAVLGGVNTERSVSCISSVARSVEIKITRKVYALEQDQSKKADADKALLEDLQLIVDDLEKNYTLTTGKFIAKYISDSGIVPIFVEKDNFLSLVISVTVEYQRNL
jgi:hypothetical protein